jgi:hypothetical protein
MTMLWLKTPIGHFLLFITVAPHTDSFLIKSLPSNDTTVDTNSMTRSERGGTDGETENYTNAYHYESPITVAARSKV